MFVKTFVKTKVLFEEFKNDERGVTAIEYAIVAVAIASIVALVFGSDTTAGLGKALSDAMKTVISKVN